MPANIQVDANDIPYVDASDIVWECANCPCGVECPSNPDARLPETLVMSPDFCGNLSSQVVEFSPGVGQWVFVDLGEFVVAESADYRLTCSSFYVKCCNAEGVFYMYGVFAFYELGLDGVTWILLTTISTAVNYHADASSTSPCFTGTPQYDPDASLVINDTDPFSATFTFYPHIAVQTAGYGAKWATFTSDIGCADDEQPINIGIA